MTTEDYTWGVTGENLTCIVRKETEHVLNRFILRFQEEYLFTYIILLHRKFELYKILTDLGVGEMNDLPTLNAYQDQLNSYQTDYAYERITEVPQYHRLYKKIEGADGAGGVVCRCDGTGQQAEQSSGGKGGKGPG